MRRRLTRAEAVESTWAGVTKQESGEVKRLKAANKL